MKYLLRLNHLCYITTFLRKYRFSKNGNIFSAHELFIISIVEHTLLFSIDFLPRSAHVCWAYFLRSSFYFTCCLPLDSCVMVLHTQPPYFLMTFTLILITPLMQAFNSFLDFLFYFHIDLSGFAILHLPS